MIERIADFIAYLRAERGFSHNTICAYQNDLTQLADFARTGPVKLDLTDRGTILAFLLHLHEREYAPSTVARKVAAVKSFYHFLHRQGWIDANLKSLAHMAAVALVWPPKICMTDSLSVGGSTHTQPSNCRMPDM